MGFELDVDGLRVDLSLPGADALATSVLPPAIMAASKLGYLRDTFRGDKELPDDLNGFQRDWLFQILLSALMSDAAITSRSMDAVANELLDEDRLDRVLNSVMDELFGTIPPTLPDDGDVEDLYDDDDSDDDDASDTDREYRAKGDPASSTGPSRLQQALAIQLARPVVRDRLCALAEQLSTPDPQRFGAWLRRLILDTLGDAMLQACIGASPRHATVDNLLVDIHDDAETGKASVWITEATLGGAGMLQAFAERFVSEPRIFFAALEAALAPTDLELVDGALREILARAVNDADVADHMARLRATNAHGERATLWQSLSHSLTQSGSIDLSHALSVSLNNRLLRSGSGPQLDQLLLDLQDHWNRLEQRFGLSIGLREFAYICSKDTKLTSSVRLFLSATLPANAVGHVTVLAAVTNLLWPRADEVRQRTLQSYNPYRQGRSTDPAVVRHLLLSGSIATIELTDREWRAQLDAAVRVAGCLPVSRQRQRRRSVARGNCPAHCDSGQCRRSAVLPRCRAGRTRRRPGHGKPHTAGADLMLAPSRDLHGPAQSRGVRDLLQSLFVAELINPSPKLWLFFAWISDVEILDNSARQFATLEPDWPAAPIRLSQVLGALLSRGVEVRLIIREHGHNEYFIAMLQALKTRYGDLVKWTIEKRFHAKGLLSTDYFLSGSMNLTLSGISVNGEHVVLRTDPSAVAEQAIELETRWESLLR